MRLFFGNFDFEAGLAEPGARDEQVSARIRRLSAEMAPLWLSIAEDGDAIWCPEPIDEPFWADMAKRGFARVVPVSRLEHAPRGARLCPWGWNQKAVEWGRAAGLSIEAPPLDVVRAANSRRFSSEWEVRLGTALPGAVVLDDPVGVQDALNALGVMRWVIKSEFSHAARERILGQGTTLEPAAAAWIRKRLERDSVLFLEPWVDRVTEIGVQWTVERDGTVTLEGVTELLTHPDGRYLGSRFQGVDREAAWIREAVDASCQVATDLGRKGYFGPLGIDAMLYRDPAGVGAGGLAVRPIQDINARWTMGRLSLGWRRPGSANPLKTSEDCPEPAGIWFHGPIPTEQTVGPYVERPIGPIRIAGEPARYCTSIWTEVEKSVKK